MDERVISEPMYLSRGAVTGDIFIPAKASTFLTENQRLGIRYIYRQYKRACTGIIVNDPAGSGKKLQISLFLDAIKNSLSEPCLILCNENDISKWQYHFEKWTEETEDIVYEIKNLYVEKKIFISPYEMLPLVSRRDWSIVVVDDSIVSKAILKSLSGIRASFKIWMIDLDLHKNVETYQRIHDWLDPNKKFWLENIPDEKPNNLISKVNRNIMLDSYFEDVMLNRFYLKKRETVSQKPKTVTRKNKDPTGTKVKRTKRKIIIEEENESNVKNSKLAQNDEKTKVEVINTEIDTDLTKFNDDIMEQDNNENNDMNEVMNDSKINIKTQETMPDSDMEIQNGKFESEFEKTDENQNTTESMELDLSNETNLDKSEIEINVKTDSSSESMKLVFSEENSIEIGESVIERVDPQNMDVSTLDEKMQKLESETKNQFKGSILDQLF